MKNKDLNEIITSSLGLDTKNSEPVLTEATVLTVKEYTHNTEALSNKTKNAHYELYQNYIKQFNNISAQLDVIDMGEVNPNNSKFRCLKQNEVHNMNAAYLHELYFANSSDMNSEILMESLAYIKLQHDFGTFDNWQRDFVACGLAAGVGWAMTAYNMFLGRYQNYFIDDHSINVPVGVYPLIVLDMWEHASRDYLNHRKEYIYRQMRELNWNVIEERFIKAEAIAAVLK